MIQEAKKRIGSSRLHFSVQDAAHLPYAPESFDAVVIANALHILPEPDRVLREIQRVLKPGGWLFAPTFVHGGGRLARLCTWCMERTGFHVYHRWNAGEFVSYLSMHDFWVVEHALAGGRVLPFVAPPAGGHRRNGSPRRAGVKDALHREISRNRTGNR